MGSRGEVDRRREGREGSGMRRGEEGGKEVEKEVVEGVKRERGVEVGRVIKRCD